MAPAILAPEPISQLEAQYKFLALTKRKMGKSTESKVTTLPWRVVGQSTYIIVEAFFRSCIIVNNLGETNVLLVKFFYCFY
jgi:hypothetical protein